MNRSCSRLGCMRLADATLIVILLRSRKSRMQVTQQSVMYGTHSLGHSSRWKPQPDSSCRDLKAITMRFPTESFENTWSVKCCTCRTPWSTLMPRRAIPHMNLDLLGPEGQRKRREFSFEAGGFSKSAKEAAALEAEQGGGGRGLASPPAASSTPLGFTSHVATATKTKVCMDLIEKSEKLCQAPQEASLAAAAGPRQLLKRRSQRGSALAS